MNRSWCGRADVPGIASRIFTTMAPHSIEETYAPVSPSACCHLLHQSGSDREKRGFFASEAKSREAMTLLIGNLISAVR
jgi:hypothetical protein